LFLNFNFKVTWPRLLCSRVQGVILQLAFVVDGTAQFLLVGILTRGGSVVKWPMPRSAVDWTVRKKRLQNV